MQTTYRLKADELNEKFLASVKSLFGEREIEIAICDATSASEDETAYLLSTDANRKHLLESLKDADTGRNLIRLPLEDLKKAAEREALTSRAARSRTLSNGRNAIPKFIKKLRR